MSTVRWEAPVSSLPAPTIWPSPTKMPAWLTGSWKKTWSPGWTFALSTGVPISDWLRLECGSSIPPGR